MKKIVALFAMMFLYHIAVFGQKKYEMVIVKTNGTEVVIKTEDIVRTFFRERSEGVEPGDEKELLAEFQECDVSGVLINDATDYEAMHMKLYNDGTGDWWTVSKGIEDALKYSFTYTYTLNGTTGTATQTVTSSTNPAYIGMRETQQFTYSNGILHGGEIYYKLIGETNNEAGNGTDNHIKSYTTCPDSNHPHLIDLGLPSGTKWACCNVGASVPEENGLCFAWGETKWKGVYDYKTYVYERQSTLGKDIAGTQYDAATKNWGAPWQMPSLEQCEELINKCFSEWTTRNGVYCRKFTGPNSSNIYLPATGYRSGNEQLDTGKVGYYWSSSYLSTQNGYGFYFSSGKVEILWNKGSWNGLSVRPVCKNSGDGNR